MVNLDTATEHACTTAYLLSQTLHPHRLYEVPPIALPPPPPLKVIPT